MRRDRTQVLLTLRRGMTIGGLWSFVAALLPGIASLLVPMSTVDLTYHLRAGAISVRQQSPLTYDLFSFTAAGAPWLNQQWGAQVVLWAAYDAWGWVGLALMRAALISGTYLMLAKTCRQRGMRPRNVALLTAAGFVLAAPYLGLRPQLLGVLLFAAFLRILEARTRKPAALWLLPVLSAVWANVHGSFPLGLALLGIAALEDSRNRPQLRWTLAACVVSALATLANPFGIHVWSYAFGLATNPIVTQAVTEWAPPNFRTALGAPFFVSVFGFVGWLILRPTRPPWTTVLKAGVLASLGFIALRGAVWWAVALPQLIAEARSPTQTPSTLPPTSPSPRSRANLAVATVLLILGGVFLSRWLNPIRSGLLSTAPANIVRALAEHLEPGDRIFNAQIWGSWLEYALPENPVFVDSRIELFHRRIWEQYLAVSTAREGWQEILNRWRITGVAADRGQQADLIPWIRRDPSWQLVYEGDEGLVFVRA